MQNEHWLHKISCADFAAPIATGIKYGLAESVFEYIENMASQLAMMSTTFDHQFLSYC